MDFDGDGRPDLLSGSHCCDSYGFHVYRRAADGSWSPREHFQAEGGAATFGFMHRSHVTAADWDGDGVPDLLWQQGGRRGGIGVAHGPFRVGRPVDVAQTVEFAPHPTTVDEGVAGMAVVDWDRDGRPDLLVHLALDGGKGGICWYRNLCDQGLRHLAPGVLLVGEGELWRGASPGTRRMSGFAAGDLDGDGWPDLVIARQDLVPPGPAGAWQSSVWWYRRE